MSHRFFNSSLKKKKKNWVGGCWSDAHKHTKQNGCRPSCSNNTHTHTHMKKSSVGVVREKCKKKKPSTFFAQHCLVIRHVLSKFFVFGLFVFQKWNTQLEVRGGGIRTTNFPTSLFLLLLSASVALFLIVAIVDRIGTTRCAFLSPVFVAELYKTLLLHSEKSFVFSLGRICCFSTKMLPMFRLGGYFHLKKKIKSVKNDGEKWRKQNKRKAVTVW